MGPLAFERITVDRVAWGAFLRPGFARHRKHGARPARIGLRIEQVLEDYPYLERSDILAALEFAAAVVNKVRCRSFVPREA